MTAPDPGSLAWRKSSRSANQATCVELAFMWLKSSRSANHADCVELGRHPEAAAIRDSKNPAGPMLTFEPQRVMDFLTSVKAGRFDR
ncbi:DUF397 domain-containing protein [Gandjariella thermophila]|uniref:DUF397 domain-containing protein n=1 Tax=Gandjariella thermophila TaxID=1931992 RepID=A0A4D4J2G7_9PSEU|nr:DUF397 domain-containing protein [Gandjariella thermophila]GDY30671.1 hypothetical protein GTS_23040 [Gandjariella thermophila]